MFKQEIVFCFIIVSVYAHPKDVQIKSTTQKTPELRNRFFGLENILGQIFQRPGYQNQQYPPAQSNNWQPMQTPNQAQSNLDLQLQWPYPQGGSPNNFGMQNQQFPNQQGTQQNMNPQESFPQNNFGPGPIQNQEMQFPNQQNTQNMNQYPPQSNQQGNFNGNNENFNTGTLDDVPHQHGINLNQGNWNNGNQLQNQGNQNQLQNGNQGFQSQTPHEYNPAAILGKPVTVTTSGPDSIVFEDGCDTAEQKQCAQDCQSSSEYRPVCGSNNVTYFNAGRFICARNCGVNVFIQREGRCKKLK